MAGSRTADVSANKEAMLQKEIEMLRQMLDDKNDRLQDGKAERDK